MKKSDLELGVEYVLARTDPDHSRVRFTSLSFDPDPQRLVWSDWRKELFPAGRVRAAQLPAEQFIPGHGWQPTLVRPADVLRRADHPDEVARRERLAERRAKAERARAILAALGFSVAPDGELLTRASMRDRTARIVRVSSAPTPEPLVELDLDAFLTHIPPLLAEWEEARADWRAG